MGTRTELAVDKSRDMGFANSGKRKLMIQLFYPRASKSPNGKKLKCKPAGYAPDAIIDRLKEETIPGQQTDIKSGVCKGGPVAKVLHPVIVLSHAYTATGFMYTSLASDLASRGFIVAAIDHTYEAFAVTLRSISTAGSGMMNSLPEISTRRICSCFQKPHSVTHSSSRSPALTMGARPGRNRLYFLPTPSTTRSATSSRCHRR